MAFWMFLSLLGSRIWGEKPILGEVTMGCASFPCFPQITDSSFLTLQGFFFFCKILILLKVNEGEHFPAHVFLLLKVQTPNAAIFFSPSSRHLMLHHLVKSSVMIASVLDVAGCGSGQDFVPIVQGGLGVKAS